MQELIQMRYKPQRTFIREYRVQRTIRVDPDLWDRLEGIAHKERISKSDALELALLMFLDYEDYGIRPGEEAQPTHD